MKAVRTLFWIFAATAVFGAGCGGGGGSGGPLPGPGVSSGPSGNPSTLPSPTPSPTSSGQVAILGNSSFGATPSPLSTAQLSTLLRASPPSSDLAQLTALNAPQTANTVAIYGDVASVSGNVITIDQLQFSNSAQNASALTSSSYSPIAASTAQITVSSSTTYLNAGGISNFAVGDLIDAIGPMAGDTLSAVQVEKLNASASRTQSAGRTLQTVQRAASRRPTSSTGGGQAVTFSADDSAGSVDWRSPYISLGGGTTQNGTLCNATYAQASIIARAGERQDWPMSFAAGERTPFVAKTSAQMSMYWDSLSNSAGSYEQRYEASVRWQVFRQNGCGGMLLPSTSIEKTYVFGETTTQPAPQQGQTLNVGTLKDCLSLNPLDVLPSKIKNYIPSFVKLGLNVCPKALLDGAPVRAGSVAFTNANGGPSSMTITGNPSLDTYTLTPLQDPVEATLASLSYEPERTNYLSAQFTVNGIALGSANLQLYCLFPSATSDCNTSPVPLTSQPSPTQMQFTLAVSTPTPSPAPTSSPSGYAYTLSVNPTTLTVAGPPVQCPAAPAGFWCLYNPNAATATISPPAESNTLIVGPGTDWGNNCANYQDEGQFYAGSTPISITSPPTINTIPLGAQTATIELQSQDSPQKFSPVGLQCQASLYLIDTQTRQYVSNPVRVTVIVTP